MTKTTIEEFAKEVETERYHQATKWGDGTDEGLDAVDEANNSAMDFTGFIAHHATRWFPGEFPPYSLDTINTFRTQMVKVATLAYAAIRWADDRLKKG